MKFFDLEMEDCIAAKVEVWEKFDGLLCDKTSFKKGPLDETCQSDGTIWLKGQGQCKGLADS